MIKLTLTNDLPILVNPDWIVDIMPTGTGGSELTLIKSNITVKEDIGSIAILLKRMK